MSAGWRGPFNAVLGTVLCLFTLTEVNYPNLSPPSRLAIFALLGLVLCFVNRPLHPAFRSGFVPVALDLALALSAVVCCGYIVVQNEPALAAWWIDGQSLGNRAGQEIGVDVAVGVVGLLLVLEATRRSIGVALPLLALIFLGYCFVGPQLPDWLFPHRGYSVERVVAQTFLHSQGVFGTALGVMFTYVFLFVIFGGLLKQTGATQFIIDFARRVLGSTTGGPAKVSVLSSGMMGSLSGSAVANTATTGTFTIPMMRSAGFRPEIAAGVEAAASSGGALVPPVMGAGAYMMLEIVEPAVTYVQIIRAALIPAILYYVSLLLIVHFYARRIGAGAADLPQQAQSGRGRFEGLIFASGFFGLILFLLAGYTVFRAVSLAMLAVLVVASMNRRTRITPRRLLATLSESGRDVVPLVAAAACVGIVIGVVTLTGVGTKLPTAVLGLSQGNLVGALVLIMVSSIILGMGLPSAVCYLLMATLVGPVLGQLGVVPLGAHLFIFYFGMMSMVTPPVALAAYAAGSIAGASIMQTGLAAFRFALVGFTLPYMFVFSPALLMLDPDGSTAGLLPILGATLLALIGIVPLAAGIAGHLFGPVPPLQRGVLFAAAAALLLPWFRVTFAGASFPLLLPFGLIALASIAWVNRRQSGEDNKPESVSSVR